MAIKPRLFCAMGIVLKPLIDKDVRKTKKKNDIWILHQS
jgi:hypothetical protein